MSTMITKTCPICSTEFTDRVGIGTRKYCGDKCRCRAEYLRQVAKRGDKVPAAGYTAQNDSPVTPLTISMVLRMSRSRHASPKKIAEACNRPVSVIEKILRDNAGVNVVDEHHAHTGIYRSALTASTHYGVRCHY